MPFGNTSLHHCHPHYKVDQEPFYRALVRLLSLVTTEDPTLAQYVEIVNFDLVNLSLGAAFTTIGHCFAMFPNLHTVKLDVMRSKTDTPAHNGFKRHSFPQIRSLTLSSAAFPLIASCPNVRSVEYRDTYYRYQLSKWIPDSCRIETLYMNTMPGDLSEIITGLPNLQEITLPSKYGYQDLDAYLVTLSPLSVAISLRTIIFEVPSNHKQIAEAANFHLSSCRQREGLERKIIVRSASWLPKSSYAEYIIVIPASSDVI